MPSGVIFRMLLFPKSAINRLSLPSTAMSNGMKNRASGPGLWADPDTPGEPAIVLTLPAGVILRMVWL